jgi:hypothetical protein
MPIQLPTGILRRLQDTIYNRDPEMTATTPPPSTIDSNETSSRNEFATQTSDEGSVDTVRLEGDTSPIGAEDYSPPFMTFQADQFSPRIQESTSTTSRQRSSTSTLSAPDVNAQSILRKRILDIQLLKMPEREKAKRVQVRHISS